MRAQCAIVCRTAPHTRCHRHRNECDTSLYLFVLSPPSRPHSHSQSLRLLFWLLFIAAFMPCHENAYEINCCILVYEFNMNVSGAERKEHGTRCKVKWDRKMKTKEHCRIFFFSCCSSFLLRPHHRRGAQQQSMCENEFFRFSQYGEPQPSNVSHSRETRFFFFSYFFHSSLYLFHAQNVRLDIEWKAWQSQFNKIHHFCE